MRRLLLLALFWCLGALLPAMAQGCDVCPKKVDSLDKPLKLSGQWQFTREDKPENAQPGIDTRAWKLAKTPGPWKKIYDDGQIYHVGWYRGEFEFAPNLVGQEVVLLVNTYMAATEVFVDGQAVHKRPHNANVERYYSVQAMPVRFVVKQAKTTIAIRVDTPLMYGVYQLPFELHRYDPHDKSLIGWAVMGGELRVTIGWIALFFGLFFLQVYAKTRYSYYLVAALSTLLSFQFLITPADYLMALWPGDNLLYLHYFGLYAGFFFFLFSQFFHEFKPKVNWVFGVLLGVLALGIAGTAVHHNLHAFHAMRSVYFLTLGALMLVSVYFCWRGVRKQETGARTTLIGMALFAAAVFNDMLLGLGVIQSISLGATGLSLALIAMLYVAINRFADTFVENRRLVGDLRHINENLEHLIAERTAALREKTNDIQAMLQNMPQGVLTLTAGNKVHPEYSAYLGTILETQDIAGRDVMDLVFSGSDLGADARSSLEVSMASVIGEDSMNYEFNSHLLVSECGITTPSGAAKALEFTWSPITDDNDSVEKLMLCVRDVTELRRLAAEAAGQKRELELIGEILAVSQEKFQSFIESSQAFIAENRQVIQGKSSRDADAVNLLFRNMHTIKGNARTYGLLHLTNVVHECEQDYDLLRKDEGAVWDGAALLARLDEVEALVAEYHKINDQTLGRKGPGRRGSVEKFLMVDRAQLSSALQSVQGVDRSSLQGMQQAIAALEKTLKRMGTEPLPEILSGVVDSLPSLAQELGRAAPQVRIDDHGLAIKSQMAGLLRNLFTHLLRNAVDHGIEPAAERQAAGKPAQGLISLDAQVQGDKLRMLLRDDGRGLALAKIRERALERGLIEQGAALNDEQVAQLIFLPGFSTAEHVTEVSGRGVGMDAVKDFLAREAGKIELRFRSADDAGRAFRAAEFLIELPAAVAVEV